MRTFLPLCALGYLALSLGEHTPAILRALSTTLHSTETTNNLLRCLYIITNTLPPTIQ